MATLFIQLSILLTSLFFAGCTIEMYESDVVDITKIQLDVGESKSDLDDDSPDKTTVQTSLYLLTVSNYRYGLLSSIASFLRYGPSYLIRAPPNSVII